MRLFHLIALGFVQIYRNLVALKPKRKAKLKNLSTLSFSRLKCRIILLINIDSPYV